MYTPEIFTDPWMAQIYGIIVGKCSSPMGRTWDIYTDSITCVCIAISILSIWYCSACIFVFEYWTTWNTNTTTHPHHANWIKTLKTLLIIFRLFFPTTIVFIINYIISAHLTVAKSPRLIHFTSEISWSGPLPGFPSWLERWLIFEPKFRAPDSCKVTPGNESIS